MMFTVQVLLQFGGTKAESGSWELTYYKLKKNKENVVYCIV